MESKRRNWYMIIILVTFSLYLSPFVQCNNSTYNPNSLDALVHDYASQAIMRSRTGSPYRVSLPANLSGMEVSVVRLRSGTFRTRGVNYTSFSIPPRILPSPFVKRLAIVYQDLGNLSSYYYNVPGYKLVSPVLGFFAYDASNLSAIGDMKLDLRIMGDPISIRFPHVLEAGSGNATLKCVKFGDGGVAEMISNMSVPNMCFAQGQGHFSVVVPSPPNRPEGKKKKERFWKWWVVGFGGGFVGLVLVGFVGVLIYKLVRRKRMEEMERESEKGVAFDTVWIGRSKLPSASMIRTQPSLENELVP